LGQYPDAADDLLRRPGQRDALTIDR
jgi:hypothetical protein